MATRKKQNHIFDALSLGTNRETFSIAAGVPTPNAAAGVTMEKLLAVAKKVRFELDGVRITIDADDDFGSVKLCDMPATNILHLGTYVKATATGDGETGGVEDITTVDFAIGTAALASIDFSGPGEKNLIPEIDVAALGAIAKVSTSTEACKVLTGETIDVFLNAQAAITADGFVDLDGFVEILYVDLGSLA